VLQILEAGDFAGGMALEGQRQFIGWNARPVIADRHQGDTALLGIHFDAPSARIECIFDEFLRQGRGSLDDLAGSDLIDQVGGK